MTSIHEVPLWARRTDPARGKGSLRYQK